MPLSSAIDAAVAPPAPNPAHAHGEHSGHSHSEHARPTSRRPDVRIGASVLRLSLLARLGIAGVLLAVLWTTVALVTGGQP